MRSLPRRQRSVAARIFQYLVTPSGTKIALPPSALAKWAKQKEAKVESVLKTLAGGERRILRTVSGVGEAETSYEIFHDRLAAGILDWRRRYGRRRTIKRSLLLVIPPLAVALVAALGWAGYQKAQYSSLSTEFDFLKMQDGVEAAARRSPYFAAILPGHDAQVNSVAISGDGRVVTASDDGTVVVSRSTVRGGMLVIAPDRKITVEGFPSLALFSPDGRLLGVETSEEWAGVWGPDGKKRFEVEASGTSNSLAFTPDGRSILTALKNGKAHLWDVSDGSSVKAFQAAEKDLATAALSRDGRMLVTTGEQVARVWDATRPDTPGSPFPKQGAKTHLTYAALSPDGRSLLTLRPGNTRLWDVAAYTNVLLDGAGPRADTDLGYDLTALADFAPDGRFALAGRRDVPVYDKMGGLAATLRGHTAATTVVRFSPDGRSIATGETDGTSAHLGRKHGPVAGCPHRPSRSRDRARLQPGRQAAGHRRS